MFLAAFVHLKEGSLDPRTLIWISVGTSIVGYTVWELLDSRPIHSDRYANRP